MLILELILEISFFEVLLAVEILETANYWQPYSIVVPKGLTQHDSYSDCYVDCLYLSIKTNPWKEDQLVGVILG